MNTYRWFEAIDEIYHTEDGEIECENGYNVIDFNDPKKALEHYEKNISHWASGIETDDMEFVTNNPKIAEYKQFED